MKKNKLIILVLAMLISCVQLTAQTLPNIYKTGALTHTVYVERQGAPSTGIVVTDEVSGVEDPILALTFMATFSISDTRGSLCIHLSSASTFTPSGELEVWISNSSVRNMYGKVSTKTVSGVQTASITYFDGLADLRELLVGWKEPTIRCTLYSKRGSSWHFEMPTAFFTLE